MFIIVYDYNKNNKILWCLTDTSLYIYICVKHFGMANIKFVFSKAPMLLISVSMLSSS